jgi:hypothetical protein
VRHFIPIILIPSLILRYSHRMRSLIESSPRRHRSSTTQFRNRLLQIRQTWEHPGQGGIEQLSLSGNDLADLYPKYTGRRIIVASSAEFEFIQPSSHRIH